ncbi:regulatory protein, gntR family [Arthrobacter sp. ok909]|uniref:FadR/GntR family transcriptional regulator n=1 Tax=Arthrobacter sp. ok909 TaxID=1761746 RepID=UPI000885F836|nr:GntR family transcriptional regulator [Arthrobacter sp. ok909]SDP51135.1 regulatory protein, gntR family [Arthrobacter sp. ok909]
MPRRTGWSRSAVREALAALEILGIVIVRPGSGTYLRDGISELLPRTRELVELRGGLEVQAGQLAAQRITDDALERMRGNSAPWNPGTRPP